MLVIYVFSVLFQRLCRDHFGFSALLADFLSTQKAHSRLSLFMHEVHKSAIT